MTILVSYYFILETIPNFHSFLKSLTFQHLTSVFLDLPPFLPPYFPSLPPLPSSFFSLFYSSISKSTFLLLILHGIMLRNQSMRYFRIALL